MLQREEKGDDHAYNCLIGRIGGGSDGHQGDHGEKKEYRPL